MRHDDAVADPAAPPPRDRRLRVVRDDERAAPEPPRPPTAPTPDIPGEPGPGGNVVGSGTVPRPRTETAPGGTGAGVDVRSPGTPPVPDAAVAPERRDRPGAAGRSSAAGGRGPRAGAAGRVGGTVGLVTAASGAAAAVDAAVGELDGLPAVYLLALFALPLWDRLPARVVARLGLLVLVVAAVGAAWFGLAGLRPEPWWRAEVAFGLACAAVGTVHALLPRRRTVVS